MYSDKRKLVVDTMLRGIVQVYFNPVSDGVVVPLHLRKQKVCMFEYGYGLPVPMNDLLVYDEGIKATLSFDRKPFETFVPWHAVFGIGDGSERIRVWESSAPTEWLRALRSASAKGASLDVPDVPAKPKPSASPFRVIRGGKA